MMHETVLRIDVGYLDGLALVSPHGEIDMSSAFALRVALEEFDATTHVAVDMANVHFMDSSGLSVLVEQMMRFRDGAGSLHVRNPNACVRRVIEITSLGEFLYAAGGA
jgi:stage II sporulation protein AA (anti-sigma F factor antagonist)